MKIKFFGIAAVFAIIFSLVLSSVAFAKGCPYSGGKKSSGETAPEKTEEGREASDAE